MMELTLFYGALGEAGVGIALSLFVGWIFEVQPRTQVLLALAFALSGFGHSIHDWNKLKAPESICTQVKLEALQGEAFKLCGGKTAEPSREKAP